MANLFYLKRLVYSTAAPDTNGIVQEPPFIIKRSAESVDRGIHCSHGIRNYDVILWYKREGRGALKLLGHLNVNFVNLEDDVKGKILFDGHGSSKSGLTIYNLTLSDSGVYFCAVRQHSAAGFFSTI
uniref:Immunoglobulin V-set domain-containing protein n=1 Tax=Mola mola TaxID=94237 RepID=A0A3Q3X772_MOLML